MSLEETLQKLEQFGNVRLVNIDTGWYAVIKMRTKRKGVDFEVKSVFDHKTPSDALDEVAREVEITLNSLEKYRQIEDK